MKVGCDFIQKWLDDGEKLDRYEVKVRFLGDFRRLPPRVVKLMQRLMKRTEKYQKKLVNILIAYGGKFELMEAFKKVAEKILKSGRIQIREKDIEENLMVSTPIDLVIRTGGRSRLSNFVMWQTAYSDIYVTKALWPDFSKKELIKSIEWFNEQKRNFGK